MRLSSYVISSVKGGAHYVGFDVEMWIRYRFDSCDVKEILLLYWSEDGKYIGTDPTVNTLVETSIFLAEMQSS